MANRFRTSFTHTAGQDAVRIVQGRVVNVNFVNYTVDVVSQFDRHQYFGIQVSGPYLHYNNGEGFSVFPDIGAVCAVCVPGDSSPPFVLTFLMPHEVVDVGAPDAPSGTTSGGSPAKNPTDASFAAGRPQPLPGDMTWRGRNGQFITLHRGGVLSMGATELAQRIYIPLRNAVMDISENYAHNNVGGSMTWGLQDGPGLQHFPTQQMSTFRVYADNQYADIRISKGRVYNAVPEMDASGITAAGIVDTPTNPIVYEVVVSPGGFVAESGNLANTSAARSAVYKYTFDDKGNVYFRMEGNFVQYANQNYTLRVAKVLNVSCATGKITATDGFSISGGTNVTFKGQVIKLNAAGAPVGRVGDSVQVQIAAMPVTLTFASPPIPGAPSAATLTVLSPIPGNITSGAPDILG